MISDHVLWRGRGSHLIRAGVVTIMYKPKSYYILEANNNIDILLRWVRMNGNYITTRAVW